MTRDETINVIHKTIYQFFGGGDGEPMSDKDELLLAVNKAICNNIKALEQEPSGDAISRQAVLESIKNLYPDMPVMDIMGARRKWLEKYAPYFECENAVEHLPSVTPKQRMGHWIEHENGFWSCVNKNGERDGWIPDYECSECGSRAWKHKTNYCPNCGAKMESEER
jgi:hypothetical protein